MTRLIITFRVTNPLLISTGFLKYPLELKKKNQLELEKKSVSLYWKKNSVRTEKKMQLELKKNLSENLKNFSWFITEFYPSLKWMPKWIFQKTSGDQQGVKVHERILILADQPGPNDRLIPPFIRSDTMKPI